MARNSENRQSSSDSASPEPAASSRIAPRLQNRRAAILDAAADLFAANGYDAVSLGDIGERVGISGPAIYRHFNSKEALLNAIVLGTVEGFVTRIQTATDARQDALLDIDVFSEIVAETVAFSLDRSSYVATYNRERRRLAPDTYRVVVKLERRQHALWRSTIERMHPHLNEVDVAAREAAAVGAQSAIGMRADVLARPRLDDLVTRSLVAVLLAPRTESVERRAPTTEPPKWVPAQSRRDDILRAAMALFRKRGFHGVGIDEVGKAAGMIGQSVYHHYESKQSLLVDAYDRSLARIGEAMEFALAEATSPCDALARLSRSYTEVAYDDVDLLTVTSREHTSLPERDRARVARRQRDISLQWIGVLREIRSDLSVAEATTLVTGVFPLVNQVALMDGHRPAESDVAELVRAFCLAEPRRVRYCAE